jgi:hypothetical protein
MLSYQSGTSITFHASHEKFWIFLIHFANVRWALSKKNGRQIDMVHMNRKSNRYFYNFKYQNKILKVNDLYIHK